MEEPCKTMHNVSKLLRIVYCCYAAYIHTLRLVHLIYGTLLWNELNEINDHKTASLKMHYITMSTLSVSNLYISCTTWFTFTAENNNFMHIRCLYHTSKCSVIPFIVFLPIVILRTEAIHIPHYKIFLLDNSHENTILFW